MSKLTLDITMSLDGFVAGPNATLEEPLGEGGSPVALKPTRVVESPTVTHIRYEVQR